MIRFSTFVLVIAAVFVSCDELEDALNVGLTDEEIVAGLREALDTGLDSAVTSGSAEDGYLNNETIKILLPDEVADLQSEIASGSANGLGVSIPYQTILDFYVSTNGNIDTDPFEELITAMNRGAEKAAGSASSIFVSALASMTITDALHILQGGETAATEFFKERTSTALISAFQPSVKQALEETAATDIYSAIVGFLDYEYPAGLITIKVNDHIGQNLDLPETLDEYATIKAVDGLFYLVGEEEKKIRKDPLAYANDIIKRVFNSDEAKDN